MQRESADGARQNPPCCSLNALMSLPCMTRYTDIIRPSIQLINHSDLLICRSACYPSLTHSFNQLTYPTLDCNCWAGLSQQQHLVGQGTKVPDSAGALPGGMLKQSTKLMCWLKRTPPSSWSWMRAPQPSSTSLCSTRWTSWSAALLTTRLMPRGTPCTALSPPLTPKLLGACRSHARSAGLF